MADNKIKIDALESQMDRAMNQINSVRPIMVQVSSIGLATSVAILTYALKVEEQKSVLPLYIAVPYLLFGVMFYNMLLMSGIFTLGGYKRYLEELLNTEIGGNFIQWEILAKKYIQAPVINYSIYSLYFIFIAGSISLIFYNFDDYKDYLKNVVIISIVIWSILTISLLFSAIRLSTLSDRVYYELTGKKKSKKGS